MFHSIAVIFITNHFFALLFPISYWFAFNIFIFEFTRVFIDFQPSFLMITEDVFQVYLFFIDGDESYSSSSILFLTSIFTPFPWFSSFLHLTRYSFIAIFVIIFISLILAYTVSWVLYHTSIWFIVNSVRFSKLVSLFYSSFILEFQRFNRSSYQLHFLNQSSKFIFLNSTFFFI